MWLWIHHFVAGYASPARERWLFQFFRYAESRNQLSLEGPHSIFGSLIQLYNSYSYPLINQGAACLFLCKSIKLFLKIFSNDDCILENYIFHLFQLQASNQIHLWSFSTQCWKCKKNRPTSKFSCFIKNNYFIIFIWHIVLTITNKPPSTDVLLYYHLFSSTPDKLHSLHCVNLMLMQLSLPELFSSEFGCKMWSSLNYKNLCEQNKIEHLEEEWQVYLAAVWSTLQFSNCSVESFASTSTPVE